ncbi:hypothetical protein K0M31_007149 [Melipona bicolor]|uniref:Uncharacterized protein n=1 Tax=Melipona bicolor TaxID=60889 RepID=A0AA40FRQ0_9HYME|nr:hypothetical protein K0M31_007149 [Melipona bicolor]
MAKGTSSIGAGAHSIKDKGFNKEIQFNNYKEAYKAILSKSLLEQGVLTYIPRYRTEQKGILKGYSTDFDINHTSSPCRILFAKRLNRRTEEQVSKKVKWLPSGTQQETKNITVRKRQQNAYTTHRTTSHSKKTASECELTKKTNKVNTILAHTNVSVYEALTMAKGKISQPKKFIITSQQHSNHKYQQKLLKTLEHTPGTGRSASTKSLNSNGQNNSKITSHTQTPLSENRQPTISNLKQNLLSTWNQSASERPAEPNKSQLTQPQFKHSESDIIHNKHVIIEL